MSEQDGARLPGDSATHRADAPPGGGSISKRLEMLDLTVRQHADAVAPAPARLLALGDIVGHYRLLGQLGRGGMGYIHRALDLQLEREVAIKVALEPISADSDALLREARALAALNHPNVVTVYESFVHDGCTYIVMELLRGETLRARMDRARPATMKALSWACEVLRGLSAAHDAHIVHLDVKPENVFLTRDGPLKLLDFGIARHRRTGLHKQDQIVGTIAYMAPEQLLGDPLDSRADIFAFGILLHELVTGTHPFSQATIPATMHALLNGEFFQNGPAAEPEVEAIVRACMALEPSARPPSAAHLLVDLERVLHAHTQGATRSQSASIRPDDGQGASEAGESILRTRAASTVPPKPRRVAPFIAGGLVAAASLAFFILGKPNAIPPRDVPAAPAAPTVTTAIAPPATPPRSKYTLELESSPLGAMVKDGDRELGTTPMAVTLDRHATETRVFTLSLEGYAKYTYRQEPTNEDVKFVALLTRAEAAPPTPAPEPTAPAGKRPGASPRAPTAAKTPTEEPPVASPLDIRLNR